MTTSLEPMNAVERRAVAALATVFSVRMLGLFLVLPVISVAARGLDGFTPMLAGLALGVYGLTQAIFQIPLGYLSDVFGRKRIITLGLLVFALGSVVAALSESIHGVILGRALQGAGAVAAAVLALAADLTREPQRTKAMAVLGVGVGFAFTVALAAGPFLHGRFGLGGTFWIIALLALCALPVLWWATPTPLVPRPPGDAGFNAALFRRILRSPELLRFDVGIFALHLALAAFFVAVPLQLVDALKIESADHWKLYVPVLLASVAGMVPLLVAVRRTARHAPIMALCIVSMIAAELTFGLSGARPWAVALGLWLFFVGFNVLEAMLPSLVSRLAPAGSRGTVMGVYNTFAFLGVFSGGALGGWLSGAVGVVGVYGLSAAALSMWLILAVTAPPLRLFDSVTLRLDERGSRDAERLLPHLVALPGVEDATVLATQGLVYLKIDRAAYDPRRIGNIPGIEVI